MTDNALGGYAYPQSCVEEFYARDGKHGEQVPFRHSVLVPWTGLRARRANRRHRSPRSVQTTQVSVSNASSGAGNHDVPVWRVNIEERHLSGHHRPASFIHQEANCRPASQTNTVTLRNCNSYPFDLREALVRWSSLLPSTGKA